MKKKRLNPLTISNKKLGNNHSGNGFITPRHEKSIVLYLNEISDKNCEPIDKYSEKELFENYWQGKKAKDLVKSYKQDNRNFTPTDITYEQIKIGEEAKNILIKSNLRFVVSVAKHYQNQGLTFEDCVSEGNFGLLKALDKFELEYGRFLSYAVWWIRQAILESLVKNGKMVRIPINKKDSLQRVNKRIALLEQELQRKPTTEEIVEAMVEAGGDIDVEDIGNILRSSLTQLSLDAPIHNKNGEEDGTMKDLLPSNEYYNASKSQDIQAEIGGILKNLTETERSIVEMYYGVLCERKYTLEEIGEKFQLTRERIRQIKEKAIRKLRNNPKIKELFEYAIED